MNPKRTPAIALLKTNKKYPKITKPKPTFLSGERAKLENAGLSQETPLR